MRLNEDFFDDNNITVDPSQYMDEQEEPVYEYHLQFIIPTYALIKDNDDLNSKIIKNPPYCFYDQELKPVIETAFMRMKHVLEYILKSSPVVAGYSPVKFCSKNPSVIETYPYMGNKPTFEYDLPIYKKAVLMETSVNLSERKNVQKLTKLFCSFFILQNIFNDLIVNVLKLKDFLYPPHIEFEVVMENPYKRTTPCCLMTPNDAFNSDKDEVLNILNYKHETD